jgi:hypothetical protein
MTHLIDAVEKGFGKPKGSEEGDAMKTFVRLQLSNEHRKEFVNQGVRTAISTALTQLSQEDDHQTGCLTMDRVFSLLEWTWRKVTCNCSGRVKKAEEREDITSHNQKALVSCKAQIMAESAAKKGKTKEEMDRTQALAETAQLRKDLRSGLTNSRKGRSSRTADPSLEAQGRHHADGERPVVHAAADGPGKPGSLTTVDPERRKTPKRTMGTRRPSEST